MRILKTFTLLTIFFLAATATARAQNLTLSQSSGPNGIHLTVTSSGFDKEGFGINTGFYLDEVGFLGRCPTVFEGASNSGTANCTVTLQNPIISTVGEHKIRAANSIREEASKPFMILPPSLSITPTCGPPGTEISVQGKNILIGSTAIILFNGSQIGQAFADAAGNVSATVEAPEMGGGQYLVSVLAPLGITLERTFILSEVGCGPVGEFTAVSCTVEVSPDGVHYKPVKAGDPINLSDIVRTGRGSNASIRFLDGSQVSLSGPGQFQPTELDFNPQSRAGGAFFNFVQGIFLYTSGLIEKKDPPNIKINTDVAGIGVRGTEFISQYDEVAGTVEIDLIHGSLEITPNQTVTTTVYTGPIKIVVDSTSATSSPLTQEEYDALKESLFGADSPDTSPPQVAVSFDNPPGGQDGFFKSGQTPVAGSASASDAAGVTAISCSDTLSGLTVGSLMGGSTTDATRSLSVGGDGIHTITCSATDGVNNSGAAAGSSSTATVKIDTTPPAVTYSGNLGSYTVDQTVSITCAAADALSGVAAHTCSNINGPAYSFNLGNNTFGATATDNAGNSGNGSTSFTVAVTYDSLINLVYRFVTKPSVANKMADTLQAAKAAAARGNTALANKKLDSFISQAQTQIGKTLTADQATILISLATALKT